MGTLFSGVGLATGLNISQIVDNLIAISARPRDLLVQRIGNIDAQKTAFLDLSARISAMLANLTALSNKAGFTGTTSTSSQPDVLSVTTGASAVPGSYDFIVRQLATTHQLVSRGFSSLQQRLDPGTLTIESAAARVDKATELSMLNGDRGVQRGSFTIRDGAGAEATINVGDALTLNDVIERINDAGINVRADIVGDAIRLTETTGGTLSVSEVDGGHVAADLGFGVGNTSSGGAAELVGSALIALGETTPLSALRDGLGVRTAKAGGDFTINGVTVDLSGILKPDTQLAQLNGGNGVRLGTIRVRTFNEQGSEVSTEVDLTGLSTVQEVKDAIETAVPDVTVTLTSGRLVVGYTSTADSDTSNRRLAIEDASGSAASDLGIADDADNGKIDGRDILTTHSVADVLAAINYASGNDGTISARVEGTRIVLDAGGAAIDLAAVGNSQALADLGFAEGSFGTTVSGARLVSGLNSSLISTLNGGRGYSLGAIDITVGGSTTQVDLTGAETLGEAVAAINAASQANQLGITAAVDRNGTRLLIRSDDGQQTVSIADVAGTGTFAADTGLAGQSGPEIRSNDLEKQYLSENTSLGSLNGGAGVSLGTIKITNGDGVFISVDLSGAETLGDVVAKINSTTLSNGDAFSVTARINDTGDGIVLEDSSGGTLGLTVADETGTAAQDLRLAGESDTGVLDGSFETQIEISANDTLTDVVDRINAAGNLATASVLNDGSEINPYRLQLSATQSGLAGELLIDDGGSGLDLSTLSRAQDAAVTIGADPASGFVVSSATNTFTDIVPGVTLNLVGTSDQPVSVSVARDIDSVVSAVDGLVSGFNAAIDRIDELSSYDPDTQTAGILLGDGTLQMIERRLFRLVTGNVEGATGRFRRLSEVGVRLDNGKLTFDETKFRDALANDPQAVTDFFTDPDHGVATALKEQIDAMTQADGLLDQRESALDRQKKALNDRVDALNELLSRKRDRLTRQFLAMESAVSQLQAQQAALSQLGSASFGLPSQSTGSR